MRKYKRLIVNRSRLILLGSSSDEWLVVGKHDGYIWLARTTGLTTHDEMKTVFYKDLKNWKEV